MAPFPACLLRLFLTQFQIYEGVLITARKNRFGEIGCTALTVVDKTGRRQILLSAAEKGGILSVYDKDGKSEIALSIDEKGGILSAFWRKR